MSNVCDYIKWRGDLELSQSEFNEIDNLILSRFSYFPFDKIINYNEVITIKELGERFSKQDIKKLTILWKDDIELFPIMSNSKRFGTMKATKFVNKIEVENEKQFSAITIIMPDNTLYVSFRGTDNTIVGWKEDFNMSFKSHIASQISAKEYLNMIAELYPNKKIRVGGHSKGGNIAVYSAIFATPQIRDRIINVYNNDGPGFCEDILETQEYQEMINKVHTYIPQSKSLLNSSPFSFKILKITLQLKSLTYIIPISLIRFLTLSITSLVLVSCMANSYSSIPYFFAIFINASTANV
jgi:hypothetical protein